MSPSETPVHLAVVALSTLLEGGMTAPWRSPTLHFLFCCLNLILSWLLTFHYNIYISVPLFLTRERTGGLQFEKYSSSTALAETALKINFTIYQVLHASTVAPRVLNQLIQCGIKR